MDFVTFEIAKKLKEKGFDWEESPFYSEQDRDEWKHKNSYEIPNPTYNKDIPFDSETQTMVAPHISIQKAMKWLRNEKKLHIGPCILADTDTDADGKIINEYVYWSFSVTNIETGDMIYFDNYEHIDDKRFDSYEEAVYAGIEYCLDNLI